MIPDYRPSPQVRYPVFVQDSALAMKWGFDNAARLGADPKQVYVMGHSSGGYNAGWSHSTSAGCAEVGGSPKQLAGWIGLAGPYDSCRSAPGRAGRLQWPGTPRDSQPLAHAFASQGTRLADRRRQGKLVNPVRNTGQMARSCALRASRSTHDSTISTT